MSLLETALNPTEVADSVHAKLKDADSPLNIGAICKGLKPKKQKAADFQDEVLELLEEQVRLGLAYRYPSGKNGADRFWSKDEKHLLAGKVNEIALNPLPISQLSTKLGTFDKGVDKGFVESVVRELIENDQLWEHPPAKANGAPRFCAVPPPPPTPPLMRPKNKKALEKLVKDCQKLLATSGVSVADLFAAVQGRLSVPARIESVEQILATPSAKVSVSASLELDELILKEVENTQVVSLLELRRSLPNEFRGQVFDETVLKLVDGHKITIFADAHPNRFSDLERADYINEGAHVYTTISKRS